MKTKSSYWLILYFTLIIIFSLSNFSFLELFLFDEKRIFEASLLFINTVFFIWFFKSYRITGFSKKLNWGLLILLFLLLFSSLGAHKSEWAFLEIGWYILQVQLIFICAYLYSQNNNRFIRYLVSALFLLVGVYVCHVLANTFSGFLEAGWPVWPNTSDIKIFVAGNQIIPEGFLGFSNVRFFNHLQTWSLPILTFGTLYYQDKLIAGFRYLLFLLISCWWMLVFAAEARGTLLASLCSITALLIFFKRNAHQFVSLYLKLAVAGFALYLGLFFLPSLFEGGRGYEIISRYSHHSARIELWQLSLNTIVAHPWLGLGPIHFADFSLGARAAHPHNLVLQCLVEWGIPAALIFFACLSIAYYNFVRQKISEISQKNILIKMALTATLTAALLHSMVSGIFMTPLSQLLGCIVVGWSIGYYFEQSNDQLFVKREKVEASVWILILFLIINSIFVFQKVGKDISTLEEQTQKYFKIAPRDQAGKIHFSPRFWQQGKIELKEDPP